MTNTRKKIIHYTLINVILLLIVISAAKGQNKNNYVNVNAYSTAFSLASATDLETQKVKSNAFQIMVVSKSNDQFNLYARVSSASSSTGTQMPASMLSVKLNSISPAITASYNTITLSNNDQLLQQIQTSWLFWLFYSSITLTYDLQLGPVGYDYPPGNYNFTILFTMTQP